MVLKSQKFALPFLAAALGLVTTASAGNVSLSASAGSVTGLNTTSGGDAWSGLPGTAGSAIIYYQTDPTKAAADDLSGATSEFKCVDEDGNFAPHTFNGVASNGSSVVGGSTFSDPTNGAPQYYQASWTASSTSTDTVTGSGTYDPWVVTAGDILDLGTPVGGTANLYYQTSILGGFSGATGFNLAAGQSGSYDFRIGVFQDGVQKDFLSFNVTRVGNGVASFTTTYQAYSGFELYLLGANAHDDGVDPNARIAAGTLITSVNQASRIFAADLRSDGSLRANLDFGLIYRGLTLTTGDRSTPLLAWTTTTNTVQAAPEHAAFAPLAMGTLAFLRRRSKASRATL